MDESTGLKVSLGLASRNYPPEMGRTNQAVGPTPRSGFLKVFHLPTTPGTDLSLMPSEEAWPCQHLDLELLASRTIRQYISIVMEAAAY